MAHIVLVHFRLAPFLTHYCIEQKKKSRALKAANIALTRQQERRLQRAE